MGYLVLAYYLVKYPLNWSWPKVLRITIPMFLVGYIITSGGYITMQKYFPGNYAYLEIIWYFTGINVFLMTFAVFVIVQKMNSKPSPVVAKVASLTFGIYLCHFVFVGVAYDLIGTITALPFLVRIIGMALLTFAISYLFVRVMESFAWTRRFVR